MSSFKNTNENLSYYTDTDSIILEKPLDSKYVNNELGSFKLESIIKEGYFIAPKLYYLTTSDEKSIVKAKGLGNLLTKEDNIYLYLSKPRNVQKWIFQKDPCTAGNRKSFQIRFFL
jgi:hypothetical protein